MDSLNIVAFARELIDIDSTSVREQEAGLWLSSRLRAMGYAVTEQPVADGRFNVLATLDPPAVVFSTHFDCVPPFFPSRVNDGRLYGRGSCDAKGILAAQVAAAERLRARGERRVGLLFVVGEERGSEGAAVANRSAVGSTLSDQRRADRQPPGHRHARCPSRPTARVRPCSAHGDAGARRVGDREAGRRARGPPRRSSCRPIPLLGPTYYTVALIEGGIAPNVVPPDANAEVNFRTSRPADEVLKSIESLARVVRIEEVLRVPEIRFPRFDDLGIDAAVFPFTTDVPLLSNWGVPLLFGPGSIHVAHTSEEHVDLAELEEAVDKYERIASACLQKL